MANSQRKTHGSTEWKIYATILRKVKVRKEYYWIIDISELGTLSKFS